MMTARVRTMRTVRTALMLTLLIAVAGSSAPAGPVIAQDGRPAVVTITDRNPPRNMPAEFTIAPAQTLWRMEWLGSVTPADAEQCRAAAADADAYCTEGSDGRRYVETWYRAPTFTADNPRSVYWWRGTTGYFRAQYKDCADCPEATTRIVKVNWTALPGDSSPALAELARPPAGYGATFRNLDDLIVATPGGNWIAQMLVSIGAASAVLFVLRGSALGLFAGVGTMPLSAGMMAALGWGEYWYAAVCVLLLILVVLAWGFLIRR